MMDESHKDGFRILLCLVILLISLSAALALPPMPTEFYGHIRYYNKNVTLGAVVRAYDANGTLCGIFTVSKFGYYGVLSCRGDTPDTTNDEGAESGDIIEFLVNYHNSTASVTPACSSGTFRRVDLVVPKIVCGDGFCDIAENCVACPSDCGECPEIPGGGDGDGDGDAERPSETPEGGVSVSLGICRPRWVCTEWSVCYPNGTQYRTCHDENECNDDSDKPAEVQECNYLAHCFDGIKNADETGIDCGGSCNPCPVPVIEEKPKPTPKTLPIIEFPGRICERVIDPLNPYLLLFIAIILSAIFARIVYTQQKIKKIKADTTLKDLEKAKLYLGVKRRTYLFIITLVVLTIFLMIYYYFFGICRDDNIKYLWLLFGLLTVAPIIIHRIMKFFEYTDEYKEEKYEKLLSRHYKNIMQLVSIENEHLMEIEQAIADNIFNLSQEGKFKEILDKYPEIKKIHKALLSLYDNYHDNKNPFAIERDLCIGISDLEKNKDFLKLIQSEPRLNAILNSLKGLYKHYEEKQHLYDELDEIEHPEKYLKKHEDAERQKLDVEDKGKKDAVKDELQEASKQVDKSEKSKEN